MQCGAHLSINRENCLECGVKIVFELKRIQS
ncbi:hypothetical protein HQ585_14670 [candidate division KSB1 bacterium]|nr:hypothetical protein [candidate division KSB1 bacterium]